MLGKWHEAYQVYQAAIMVVSSVALGMAWFRKGSAEEDKMVSDACDVILDVASDADKRRELTVLSGREVGSDLTVEQAQALADERDLRGFGFRRN